MLRLSQRLHRSWSSRHQTTCLNRTTCLKRTSCLTTRHYLTTSRSIATLPPKVNSILQWYEDFIGLTEVREAQNKVLEAENAFVKIQSERHTQQNLLNHLQTEIRALSAELDRLNRGDPAFLDTITRQHALFRQEGAVLELYRNLEDEERSDFNLLSAAVRESHEKERQRTERTKYWSIIGSIVGALVGMTGAGINNYLRNRRIMELDETIKIQHQQVQTVLHDFKTQIQDGESPISVSVKNGVSNKDLRIELDNIKQLIVERGGDMEGMDNIVADLEYRIKINSLATVAFVYGAFALTIPILYSIFSKGS